MAGGLFRGQRWGYGVLGGGGVVLSAPQPWFQLLLYPRMTILPPTEKLQVLLEKLSSFYAKFVKEYS